MDNIIELTNVSYLYDEESEPNKKALDSLSLTIKKGEFVGIIGHNGSGKSTLAKLLNGLLLPNEGDVIVLGMNTKDESSIIKIRQNVGMVFQNPDNQMVATIVEEDVAFGAENLGIEPSEIRRLVDESLRTVGMYEFKDKKPHQLSGGQKQRIAIARAILKDAPILILDEATSSLDSKAEHEVQVALDRLMKNRTTLIIAHRLSTIAGVDTIVTLKNGKVDEIGSPATLAQTGGIYSELLQLQLHATDRDKKRLERYEISA